MMLRHAALLLCLSSYAVLRCAQAQPTSSNTPDTVPTQVTTGPLSDSPPNALLTASSSLTDGSSAALVTPAKAWSSEVVAAPADSSVRATQSTRPSALAASQATDTSIKVVSSHKVSDEVVAIILAASLGGVAIAAMLVVFWCAFRHKSVDRRSYTRTPSPLGSDGTSKIMQVIASRQLFSSRSSNAPEVHSQSDNPAGSSPRKDFDSTQTYRSNSGEIGLALTKADARQQPSPVPESQRLLLQDARRLAEPRVHLDSSLTRERGFGRGHFSRPGILKYHSRPTDVLDAAARHSSDDSRLSRPPLLPNTYWSSSYSATTLLSPSDPSLSQISSQNSGVANKLAAVPLHEQSRDSLRSSEQTLDAPLIPRRNPKRHSSSATHTADRPGTDDYAFDESDGQQGLRERPSMAMSRRSSSWKRDSIDQRHEMA